MFKKENRLVAGVSFSNSSKFNSPQFILKTKNNNSQINRFGIIVSKKVDKRAVARNKIKRIFREELVNCDKDMKKGYDILFIIRTGIIGKTKDEITLLIKEYLGKASVLSK